MLKISLSSLPRRPSLQVTPPTALCLWAAPSFAGTSIACMAASINNGTTAKRQVFSFSFPCLSLWVDFVPVCLHIRIFSVPERVLSECLLFSVRISQKSELSFFRRLDRYPDCHKPCYHGIEKKVMHSVAFGDFHRIKNKGHKHSICVIHM